MTEFQLDSPGAIGSRLIVMLGASAIWAAGNYSDLGAVFPRTVGALQVPLPGTQASCLPSFTPD